MSAIPEKKRNMVAQVLAAFALLFGGQFLGGFALSFLMILGVVPKTLGGDTGYYISLFSTIFTIIAVLVFGKFVEKRRISSLGFTKENAPKQYGIGLLIGLVLITSVYLLNLITGSIHSQLNPSINWLAIFLCVLGFGIQGMSEEVICRGFLMGNLATIRGVIPAAVVNSALFSLLHLANPGISFIPLLNIFLVGLLFSALYYLSDNIWLVSAIHSIWNFVLGLVFGVQVSGTTNPTTILVTDQTAGHSLIHGGNFGFEGGLAATIVITLGLVACWYYFKKRNEKA